MQSVQAGDIATLRTTLGSQTTGSSFAGQSQIGGAVVDLGDPAFAGHARIAALAQQAENNPSCVYATNLVASAIKDIVTAYRNANPDLASVVLVGDDGVIPFFRYPDQNGLGPEKNYQPPVDPTSASEASLRSDYVLGQDEYGSSISLALGAYAFPIPDLPVGRLVETPGEATGILRAYLDHTTNGVVAPTGAAGKYSSLVTGYDFLADAATTVSDTLETGTGAAPDELIEQHLDRTPAEVGPDREPSRPDVPGRALQLEPGARGRRHHGRANDRPCVVISRPDQLHRVQRGLPFRLQPGRRRSACQRQPAARLGAGVRPKGRDAHRRNGVPVRRQRLPALERTDLRRVRPPTPVGQRRHRRRWRARPIQAALSRNQPVAPADGREGAPPGDDLRPADAERRPAAPRHVGWRWWLDRHRADASGPRRTGLHARARDRRPAHPDDGDFASPRPRHHRRDRACHGKHRHDVPHWPRRADCRSRPPGPATAGRERHAWRQGPARRRVHRRLIH